MALFNYTFEADALAPVTTQSQFITQGADSGFPNSTQRFNNSVVIKNFRFILSEIEKDAFLGWWPVNGHLEHDYIDLFTDNNVSLLFTGDYTLTPLCTFYKAYALTIEGRWIR